MSTEPDDLALWGATEADELLGELPQVRRIGEKLFVRVPGAEPGTAVRLPLRLSVDLMRRAIEAGDGVDQTGYVIDEVGDEAARDMWAGLDHIARVAVAARYFRETNELAGLAAGESSR